MNIICISFVFVSLVRKFKKLQRTFACGGITVSFILFLFVGPAIFTFHDKRVLQYGACIALDLSLSFMDPFSVTLDLSRGMVTFF